MRLIYDSSNETLTKDTLFLIFRLMVFLMNHLEPNHLD